MLNRRELLVGGAALVAGAGGVKLASSGDEVVGAGDEPRVRDDPAALDPPRTDAGQLPNLKFSFEAAHTRVTSGGWAREVTVRELPVAATIAGVKMHLKPGSIRELHWHAAGEWAIMLAGSARVTAIDALGRNFIGDVGTGDLWFFPTGLPPRSRPCRTGASSCRNRRSHASRASRSATSSPGRCRARCA